MPLKCVETAFSTDFSTEKMQDKDKQEKSLKSPKNGQNGTFCQICQRKTCLKTKKICVRLEKFMAKSVDSKFWHGVESFMPNPTFDLLQNVLYGIECELVTLKICKSIHI